MPEKVIDKILKDSLAKVQNVKGAEKEVSKIKKLLASGSKQAKKEYIRNVINHVDEHTLNVEEGKLKGAVKEINPQVLKEAYGDESENLKKFGASAIGTVIAAGVGAGLMVLGNVINFGTAGMSGIAVTAVISVFSTLLVAGITALVVAKASDVDY